MHILLFAISSTLPFPFPPFHILQRANILKEVQIMRGLNHPSIVRLLNFTESRDHYFLTLEWVASRFECVTRADSPSSSRADSWRAASYFTKSSSSHTSLKSSHDMSSYKSRTESDTCTRRRASFTGQSPCSRPAFATRPDSHSLQ